MFIEVVVEISKTLAACHRRTPQLPCPHHLQILESECQEFLCELNLLVVVATDQNFLRVSDLE